MLLVFNAFLFVVDACFVVALWRDVRAWRAAAYAGTAAVCGLAVQSMATPGLFVGMRCVAFVLFLHAPIALVALAWLRRKARLQAAASIICALALVAVATDAFVYEPHALVTSTYEVKGIAPMRVVVMSDFQADHIGDYERSVLARIGALKPDLLLLAGDYIQAYGPERAPAVDAFRRAWREAGIHPTHGTYAVRGDVEVDGWEKELFDGLDVTTADETRTVEAHGITFVLLGLSDSANRDLLVASATSGPHIVLGHRPDFALGRMPPGLLVAGHTHGGQVQVPFFGPPFILSAVPRRWGAGGLHTLDAAHSLLVTRGAGVEHANLAPELRFNCRPEIVLLTMTR